MQIDTKEKVLLHSGQKVSWINMADEGTTAHLKAVVQPVEVASQINLKAATSAVAQCLMRWGLPNTIKIDNGYPFVNPRWMDIPTNAKLWWIGLGIEVIQITPGSPQENGVVECLQGICSRWVNPSIINNKEELQHSLDEISDFQRNHYQMPQRHYKTRIELFPELEHNPRRYDPKLFEMERVYQYLAKQVWERKIKKKGSVHFFGQEIFLGKMFGEQLAFITFDLSALQWVFKNRKGQFLIASSKAVPTKDQIKMVATI